MKITPTRRIIQIAALLVGGLLVFVVLLAAFLCSGPEQQREIMRVTSSDGHVDAVLREVLKGGATVPTYYYLDIVPVGENKDFGDPELIATDLSGEELYWKNDILFFSYNTAKISNFWNYWYSKYYSEDHYIAEIRLVPKSKEKSF